MDKHGDALNLLTYVIVASEMVRMRMLSKNQIAHGRALIVKMRERQNGLMTVEPDQIYDEVYFQALAFLDGEELSSRVELDRMKCGEGT